MKSTTEEVGCLVFGVRKMELHTDDEKVRASIAKDATPIGLKMATMAPYVAPPNPELETTKHAENGLEHDHKDKDESGRHMASLEQQLQPLSEEALQRSGVFLAVDIPMIDDDDEDNEGTSIDDVTPDTSNDHAKPANPPSNPTNGDATNAVVETSSKASCNGLASEGVNVEQENEEAKPSDVRKDPRPSVSAPLKSALKKSRSKTKKGHRVTFHDSRIFYIDTEAETTAEPQLLTVRSLELPQATTDYKVFIPTYDFLPSVPGRSYTYEDAVVSLPDETDTAVAPSSVDTVDQAAKTSVVPEEVVQEPVLSDPAPPASPPEPVPDSSQAAEAVQSLTEANLRQHEILMEQDDVVEEPATPSKALPEASPAPAVVKNLSPPLKELSVDVSGTSASSSSWQVELSPLNSIPESETDDSSASSQDTIIMMTSEESRRNEEHIRESTESYRQQNVKATSQDQDISINSNNNGDAASTASSQDSDETLKCDESVDPGYVPPWTKGTAATLVVNGSRGMNSEQQLSFSQRTNSQIRQLMERNAVRRSLLRYSNTKKRQQEDSPVAAAIDRQRQWRSHESLLDTIKQLTVENEDEDDEEDEDDYEEIRIHQDEGRDRPPTYGTVTNGYSNGTTGGPREKTASNLSLQDVQRLIASPPFLLQQHQRSQSTVDVQVPGDVRQWKIQATRWDEARRRNNNHLQNHYNHQQQQEDENEKPVEDAGDELAQFVQRDSGRIERLRKRYSYSGSGDYEAVGAFARRSSVRGIKPRFGSTNEILKQMQSQLQPSPLANGRAHASWPYPLSNDQPPHTMTIRTTVTSRQSTNSLPSLREEIYGIVGAHRASYAAGEARGNSSPIYATLPGRSNGAPPPPYQPPPPAPPHHHNNHQQQQHQPQQQQRSYSKDERGVPEGASGSPKAATDSIYGRTSFAHQQPRNVNPNPQQVPTVADNSGVVYYVMQV